ncbi:MAG: inverse autotransporter beta domain-containing protein, partial [Candidatus Omnitrophica bacterium]|nr:inverse autotransporter beta domain-containing protein [Candidatus Omnitrophota bacterium]
YGMILQTGEKPNVYVEGVLPIYQSTDKRNTFFTHNRISVQGDNGGSFSGGLGYRQLIRDDKLLVGANTFLDYQRGQKHSRIGLGMEALADDYEIRSNVYLRLSSEKLVNETDIYRYYEKVANGYDFEVGGRYPSLPWLKTFIGYSKYYFDNSEDPRRVKGRIEIKPSNLLTINIIGHRNQATDTNHFGVDGRLSFAFDTFKPEDMWRSITNSWKPDWMENPVMPDLMSRALDRVERNFDIVIEEWTEDKITPIAVGSGGSLQIQLIWDRNNMNDMDLHLLLPAGVGDNDHIFWFADESYIGADLFANLDVDDIPLSGGHVDHPGRDHVENIYVVSGMMQPGTYTPYVHVYDFTSNVTATINVFREGAFVATYTHTFTADEQIYNLPVITYP